MRIVLTHAPAPLTNTTTCIGGKIVTSASPNSTLTLGVRFANHYEAEAAWPAQA